ncbi:MAG: hypothetical protein WC303_02770 [Candidatus Paceibacterota bacterium]|jgi:hypothetical protein
MKNKEQNISQLSNPWLLLKQSWNLFIKRAPTLWGIALLPFVYFLILFLGYWVVGSKPENILFALLMNVLVIVFVVLFLWSQVSLICAVVDKSLTIKEAYEKGSVMIWDYIVISFLTGLVILGGFFIFIIPGILLSVYLAFTMFVLINEGDREVEALLKSYEYVKEHWWPVLGRIFFIVLIFLIPIWLIQGFFMFLGMPEKMAEVWINILSIFFGPLITIYYFLTYKNLKSIKGHFSLKNHQSKRGVFIGLFLLAFVILAILAVSFFGFIYLSGSLKCLQMIPKFY